MSMPNQLVYCIDAENPLQLVRKQQNSRSHPVSVQQVTETETKTMLHNQSKLPPTATLKSATTISASSHSAQQNNNNNRLNVSAALGVRMIPTTTDKNAKDKVKVKAQSAQQADEHQKQKHTDARRLGSLGSIAISGAMHLESDKKLLYELLNQVNSAELMARYANRILPSGRTYGEIAMLLMRRTSASEKGVQERGNQQEKGKQQRPQFKS